MKIESVFFLFCFVCVHYSLVRCPYPGLYPASASLHFTMPVSCSHLSAHSHHDHLTIHGLLHFRKCFIPATNIALVLPPVYFVSSALYALHCTCIRLSVWYTRLLVESRRPLLTAERRSDTPLRAMALYKLAICHLELTNANPARVYISFKTGQLALLKLCWNSMTR